MISNLIINLDVLQFRDRNKAPDQPDLAIVNHDTEEKHMKLTTIAIALALAGSAFAAGIRP